MLRPPASPASRSARASRTRRRRRGRSASGTLLDQRLYGAIASFEQPVPACFEEAAPCPRGRARIGDELHRGANGFRVAAAHEPGDKAQLTPVGAAIEAFRLHHGGPQRLVQRHAGEVPRTQANQRLSDGVQLQVLAPALRPALCPFFGIHARSAA